jgi:hypothetical protein
MIEKGYFVPWHGNADEQEGINEQLYAELHGWT